MSTGESGLRIFNTLTRQKALFEPSGPAVKLYVCGVTPYDTTHAGHARTYLVFDVLVRHLIHNGLRVDYVQNITDVDESIVQRAAEQKESYEDLGDHYTARYIEDLANLHILPARAYPRATDAIEEMHEAIRRLLVTDHAYRVDGDVFFDVSRTPTYGELSRLDAQAMRDTEAEQDAPTVDDPRKRNELDFPLWRAVESGPTWESPWGPGRPGWHLECSTLVLKYLGRQIDIHGGGVDLIFPHHEAEIAQGEALTGQAPFSRYWMHVEMARLDGEKMSKSKGNMIFVADLLKKYSADALRLYLLGTHYRTPLDYDEQDLDEAAHMANRLSRASSARLDHTRPDDGSWEMSYQGFMAALEDDLDTPAALLEIDRLSHAVLENGVYRAQRALRSLATRLGLSLADS
ncbi:MAG: cysteine--tRNA ligase [Actinomycetota bacterium]|nr:cysteine--tRNA ligase [Actinomycetota bacterium]